MKKHILLLSTFLTIGLSSCTENYSKGERIGLVTQFSNSGLIWKSWEGHLNLTQTGMNSSSSTPFDFSLDNDNEDLKTVATLDSAAQYGWKIKIIYHETAGKNWFQNRGETSHFVNHVEVLDKAPLSNVFGKNTPQVTGRVIDTIYVIIDKSK